MPVAAKPSRSTSARAPSSRRRHGSALSVVARAVLPSGRILVCCWAVAALVAGGYAVARETSLFAVRRIDVSGAPAPLAAEVRRALADMRGRSLVGLDGAAVIGRVQALPEVEDARYDRAFPSTLRLVVRAERPVAVLRAGKEFWLVSARARVIARLRPHSHPELPRIWIPASTQLATGQTLAAGDGGAAARALAPLAGRFPARITSVTLAGGELTFTLAGRTELRFGGLDDLRAKLAVARRILPHLPAGTPYLDVSVPERPVASFPNSQVSG